MIPESNRPLEESLRERLEADPADWNARLRIACLLYDQEDFPGASALIWEAERIPCSALDLASAACILAKDQPGKAIRLLTAVLENNRGMAAQNMGMANALLHHGMVLQSARFYGAALGSDPELVNPEFEHFFVWADDEQLLWGNFKDRRTQLHELPWITRDPMEAIELTRDAGRHTTPIAVPRLHPIEVESTAIEALRGKLAENSEDWDTRQTLAQLLHDQGTYGEAAALIWESDPIPSTDLDIAFAARVLAKGKPRNAIRLLTAVFEQNLGKAVQNMAVANALLHHGLVLESARFYGAALDADPNLVNPDLEHFLLWTDDAGSLWENFLKIRPPLGIFPWAQSDPTLDFGAGFATPPILLSGLRQVPGENLTNHLYQQLAGRNARITPPPAVTFPADRAALNRRDLDFNSGGANGQEAVAGPEEEDKARVEALALAKQQKEQEERAAAAAKRLAEEQAAAEAKAAALFAEAAESARTLIERARQEATTEVAAIRAKAQEELEAALAQAHQKTKQEMAALRAKAREEAEAAADAARKEAEFQAALIRAKAEEAAAEAEVAAKLRAEEYARAFALAKQRAEEEERSIATAKRLAEEQANAAAEQAAAAKAAADKARQEATSEVAAMRAKAEEELKASLDQARQNSEQELAALRAKAREKAETEAALIRTKAEEDARVAEKARLEAIAQAEAAAKLRAEENARALALAKQRADEEERSTAAAKRLAEEQARAAAEKIREEATAEVSALRAKAQQELKDSIEQARRNTEEELAAMRAKAEEEAKKTTAAAEQARLEAAAKAKAAAEILARAEEEAQAAAAQLARREALAELAALKARAQEELKAAAEQARLNSEQELKMLRAKAREESKMLMENALKDATSEAVLISPGFEGNVMLGGSAKEHAPAEDMAGAAAVAGVRDERQSSFPVAGPLAKEQPHAVEKARIREQGSKGKRRFGVLLVSAAIAMGCWKFLPGSAPDRVLFSTVAGSFANPPLFVSGNGTHASPWKLNAMTAVPKPDKREAPVVVSLGDDLGAFFQSSPPAPIDLAVIFSNFHRLGARKAATAAVLAWEAPDPIGLAALDKALGKFDSLVTAAPLSRGAVSSTMPAAFRRASLPLTEVAGDTTALPSVNRIPLPGVIFGGEKSSAGFSTLESEESAEFPSLIARWEDRVVFAFPLLTVLQRNNFPLDGVEIRLGEYIKLSPAGPVVPLDKYGCLAVSIKPMAAFKEISAEALIDGGDGLFPKTAPEPVILRDDQSAAESATRAFSKKLSAMVAAIASDQGFASITAYPRLPGNFETGILAFFVIALTTLCGLPAFSRHVTFSVLAGTALSAQWIGVGMASVWLPLLPSLAAIATAAVVSHLIRGSLPAPATRVIDEPVETEPVVETPPAPEPKPKKSVASKKSPAEKPAKKPEEKKPPAKKAATPRKPRTKKRRTDK